MNNMEQAYIEFKEWIEVVDKYADMISDGCSCKKGCSHCCSELIFMRRIETSYIASKLRSLKRNGRKKIKKQLVEWHNNFVVFLGNNNLTFVKDMMGKTNRVRYYKIDNKCPFLDRKQNVCYIYAYRPIACRIHFVKSDPKYCKLTNTKEEVLRFDHSVLMEKIDPGLDELEGKYNLLNDGNRLFDTFDLIFRWNNRVNLFKN